MQKSHVIAEMLDQSRKFSLYYISQLDPVRVKERLPFNGELKNSAYWIVGHLGWAELGLVSEACGAPGMDIPWMKEFRKGDAGEGFEGPDFGELLQDLGRIHTHALDYIRSLDDGELEVPAYVAPARWSTVRRKALYHIVRHESFHTGQLAWIAKAHGSKLP